MIVPTTAPGHVFFFAPFVSSVMRIEPAWIDNNGHLYMAWYHHVMDRAIDESLLMLGLGADYQSQRNGSIFMAETHVQFKRELLVNMPVRTTLQLLDYDEKRIHYWCELRHAEEGWLSATSENLSLHVDMNDRKVCPFPPDILTNLQVMKAAHSALPKPEQLGRVMGIPPHKASGRPNIH
jgi:acyl-CoA thioester hydrolase